MLLPDYPIDETYQTTLSLAQARIAKNPHDISARFAFGYALYQLGEIDKAVLILKEVNESAKELMRRIDILLREDVQNSNHQDAIPSRFLQTEPAEDSNDSDFEEGEQNEKVATLSSAFYTVPLAELYIKQGHYAVAKNILENIIAHDEQNDVARSLLSSISSDEQLSSTTLSAEEQIASLECFLNNVQECYPLKQGK